MWQFQRNNFNSFSVATKTPQYTALAINSTELEGQNATDRSLCTYVLYHSTATVYTNARLIMQINTKCQQQMPSHAPQRLL